MTQVINIANFKGGVGKTTTSVMLAWNLSNNQNKVLFVDFDPQANATDLLYYKTFKLDHPEITIFEAIAPDPTHRSAYRREGWAGLPPPLYAPEIGRPGQGQEPAADHHTGRRDQPAQRMPSPPGYKPGIRALKPIRRRWPNW
ncbi:hypothetical protein BTM36_25630 [Herbaspirillum sp. VT-16-41]|nr:hypothetical protein BTM36_25630 [Herbaspirillum sp. VT-16-41]